jgi:hypothetical protein
MRSPSTHPLPAVRAGKPVAATIDRGARSPSWPGRAPAAPCRELEEVAELLGAGVAKPLLGKDVLSDELPYVTGDRAAGHPAQLRDDDALRHAADGGLRSRAPVAGRARRGLLAPQHAWTGSGVRGCPPASAAGGSDCARRMRTMVQDARSRSLIFPRRAVSDVRNDFRGQLTGMSEDAVLG